jgi:hypothetical protein
MKASHCDDGSVSPCDVFLFARRMTFELHSFEEIHHRDRLLYLSGKGGGRYDADEVVVNGPLF